MSERHLYALVAFFVFWTVSVRVAYDVGTHVQSRLTLDAYGAAAAAMVAAVKAREDHRIFHHGSDLSSGVRVSSR